MSRVTYFQDLLTAIFERGSAAARQQDERSLEALCLALMSERGEVSGHKIAHALLDRFESSSPAEQLAFFAMLSRRYDVDAVELQRVSGEYGRDQSAENFAALRHASEPGRLTLLRRLNSTPGATGRLVKMREVLLGLLAENPSFERADQDFEYLFRSWFNRGFLVMRPVNWQSPASLLEKIIAYEAVHAINDWDDLRRRLQPDDRRCFAFFHPAMPEEPLIFVEVALTKSIPGSIGQVLAQDREPIDATSATTAVFYSISNCQQGLRGVSFGNFLIKQVAADLAESMSGLKTFVTLSPVPGFVRWVRRMSDDESARRRLPTEVSESFRAIQSIADGGPVDVSNAHREAILSCAAYYFCEFRRDDGLPPDPVTRFHLGNGASLERINWMADATGKGLKQSAGIMVNYLYDLKKIEDNHEAFAQHRKVRSSRAVKGLLPREKRSRDKTTTA